MDHTLSSTSALLYSKNVAIGFYTSIAAYFMDKKVLGHWNFSRLGNYATTFD